MLKAKKSKSTKQMSQAVKEVLKEESVGVYYKIPYRLKWKLKSYLFHTNKKKKKTELQWFTEQLESLPDFENK